MHFIKENIITFAIWSLILIETSMVFGSEQELVPGTSHLSAGYDFDAYSMSSFEQNQNNNPWIASNPTIGNDYVQQTAVSNAGDWKTSDVDNSIGEIQNQNIQNIQNYEYGNNFIPSSIDPTYHDVANSNLDQTQHDALFTHNNPIIGATNEAENNQQVHSSIDSIASPFGKFTKNVPYPIVKQIHVPVQRPVNVNIPQSVLLPISHSYPVHIPIVKPVVTPVITEITIPVEKVIPFPVIKKIPYTVEKHEPYRVEKYITVHKKVPYPIKVPIVKTIIHRPKHGYQYHRDHHHGWY